MLSITLRSQPLSRSRYSAGTCFRLSTEAASSVSLTDRTAGPIDEHLRCAPNLLRHMRLRRNKFRSEPGIKPNQVVCDQDLPVAMFARANPNRRNLNRSCNLARRVRGHDFEYDRKCASGFDRPGIREETLRALTL